LLFFGLLQDFAADQFDLRMTRPLATPTLYVGLGAPNPPASSGKFAHSRGGRAQDPGSHGGKFLRLNDDGSVPKDNPFVGKPGYRPEIYTMGNRNAIGLTVNR